MIWSPFSGACLEGKCNEVEDTALWLDIVIGFLSNPAHAWWSTSLQTV